MLAVVLDVERTVEFIAQGDDESIYWFVAFTDDRVSLAVYIDLGCDQDAVTG